jgi:hypothetical protein
MNGMNITLGADFQQTGGETKLNNGTNGGGTLTVTGKYQLSAQTTATGTLSMDEGTLAVGAGLFVFPGGDVTNASGTINGNVNNAGTFRIGGINRISSLYVNGDFTQQAGGDVRMEISVENGVGCDYLGVGGTFIAAGSLNVSALTTPPTVFNPPVGTQFILIEFDAESGNFDVAVFPTLPTGRRWKAQKWFDTAFALEVEASQ